MPYSLSMVFGWKARFIYIYIYIYRVERERERERESTTEYNYKPYILISNLHLT